MAEPSSDLPSHLRKVDKRYRETNYFLMDQLRYSETVEEFRSVKNALTRASGFKVGQRAFQFAAVKA